MRILFVGMHHKPGMAALDSRTMTGKVIDKIIHQLPESDFIKVNLCETDYQPPNSMMGDFANSWKLKYQPTLDDVVVLLGGWVRTHLKISGTRIVLLKHPSGVFGKKDEYIMDAVAQIKSQIAS